MRAETESAGATTAGDGSPVELRAIMSAPAQHQPGHDVLERAFYTPIHMMHLVALVMMVVGIAAGYTPAQEPDPPAVAHAKRIFDALEHDKAEDVAKEFNAQMSAALTAPQLRQTWSAFHQQVGAFRAYLDWKVATPKAQPGIKAVVLGCQFEKSAINVVIAFDAEDKIAGLHFTPRPAAAGSEAAEKPTSTKFTEDSVIVGSGEWALPGTLSMPVGRIIG